LNESILNSSDVSANIDGFRTTWSINLAIASLLSMASFFFFTSQDNLWIPCSAVILWSSVGFFFYLQKTGGLRRTADLISFSRVLLTISLLVWFLLEPQLNFGKFLLACGTLFLDGVDGYVARRRGPTASGAILDMEADGFFTLVLCSIIVFFRGGTTALLIIPALRPLYVIATAIIGRWIHFNSTDLRPTLRGKLICVATLVVLIANIFPALQSLDLNQINFFTAGLLLYSFGADTVRSLIE
jgi:phosphatidylglycerophosphate synthase